MEKTIKIVNAILRSHTFINDNLEENMKLDEDLGLDSLKRTQVICDLEEQMDIEIDIEDLQPCNFVTVRNLYEVAEKYIHS